MAKGNTIIIDNAETKATLINHANELNLIDNEMAVINEQINSLKKQRKEVYSNIETIINAEGLLPSKEHEGDKLILNIDAENGEKTYIRYASKSGYDKAKGDTGTTRKFIIETKSI